MNRELFRRFAAEALGTAFLLTAVVGSGIMGERLAGGNAAIVLLANSLATAAALYVLIEWFGPISGAHFNPAVSIALAARGEFAWRLVPLYAAAQFAAAIAGVVLANLMFDLGAVSWSHHIRTGAGQWLSESVATFGLIGLIAVCGRAKASRIAALVAAYIGAAYWFTASTSFANPAVTMARALTDTFAGIRPADVPAFIAAQALGTALALIVFGWLAPARASQPRKGDEAAERVSRASS